MMSKLTVILPAAGKGTRLNLPYPKEMFRLNNEEALIDHSFNFFRDYGRKNVEFVVIINEDKTELVSYLSKYKDRYNITFTYQNPNEHEVTGAIKSASHLFGEHNLVLLPDTIMTLAPGADLYDLTNSSLTETGFTFLYKKEKDPEVLKKYGALTVDQNDLITAYEDKPQTSLDNYNAFWCAFAFRRSTFTQFIWLIEKSTLKQKVQIDEIQRTPIYKSKGIPVQDYRDLGTWKEIRRMLLDDK